MHLKVRQFFFFFFAMKRCPIAAKICVIFAGRLVNTPRVACHHGDGIMPSIAIMAIDVCTRHRFSESLGSRFGGPRQKALPTMNEFTLFVDFCLILYPRPVPLTYQPRICKDGFISIVTRSLISLWNAVCSTGRWSIIGRCFGACQWSSCAEER